MNKGVYVITFLYLCVCFIKSKRKENRSQIGSTALMEVWGKEDMDKVIKKMFSVIAFTAPFGQSGQRCETLQYNDYKTDAERLRMQQGA